MATTAPRAPADAAMWMKSRRLGSSPAGSCGTPGCMTAVSANSAHPRFELRPRSSARDAHVTRRPEATLAVGRPVRGGLRMRLALFQPDIPQNVGAAIRLFACLGLFMDILEPCAFPLSDRTLKRAALDYADPERITLHRSWEDFREKPGRLVLFTTKAAACTSSGTPALSRPNSRVSPGAKAKSV